MRVAVRLYQSPIARYQRERRSRPRPRAGSILSRTAFFPSCPCPCDADPAHPDAVLQWNHVLYYASCRKIRDY